MLFESTVNFCLERTLFIVLFGSKCTIYIFFLKYFHLVKCIHSSLFKPSKLIKNEGQRLVFIIIRQWYQ